MHSKEFTAYSFVGSFTSGEIFTSGPKKNFAAHSVGV